MATYRDRPDGLVDVQLDTGQTLPMSEVQAQMGGATREAPAALPGGLAAPPGPGQVAGAVPPPGAAPGPLPSPQLGPNPYSMINSGEATAQNVPQDQVENARRAADAISGVGRKVKDWFTSPIQISGDSKYAQEQRDKAAAGPAPAEAPPAPAPAAGAPASAPAAPAPASPGGSSGGGWQIDQPLTLVGGGVPLESRIVRPGVKAEPSFKRVMGDIDPENVRDEHFRASQDVWLAREEALESERLANESTKIYNEDRKNELAERRAKLQEKQNLIEQREKEASQATPQGRSEIMSSRSGLSKMMGALSIAMGGYYQGLTGRNNPGLDLINQTIAQEIADQRAKWEAAKDKVGMANNDFAKAMQLYGDPNVAEADLYNRNLTLAANIAQNHWKRAENIGEYEKQVEVGQALMEQAAAKKQEAFTLLHGQGLQDTYRREPVRIAGDLTDDQMKSMVNVPGYGTGFVANSATQPDVQKRAVAGGTAKQYVRELMELLPKSGPVNDLKDRARLEPYRVRALAAISALEGQGIVTEADAKNAQNILGDENSFFTGGRTSLEATAKALRIGMDALVRGYLFGDPHRRTRMKTESAESFTPGLGGG